MCKPTKSNILGILVADEMPAGGLEEVGHYPALGGWKWAGP